MRTTTAYPPSPLFATLQRSSRIGTVLGVAALVYVLFCLGTTYSVTPPPDYTHYRHRPEPGLLVPPIVTAHHLPHDLQAIMGIVLHLKSIDAPPSLRHDSPPAPFDPRAIARVTLILQPDFRFHIRSTFNSGSGRWRLSAAAGGQHNITFASGWTEMAPYCDNALQGEELVQCHQRLTIEALLYDAFGGDQGPSLMLVPSMRQLTLTDPQGRRYVFLAEK